MEKPIHSDFITRQEAADYLAVKKTTLEAWAVRGGGPAFCKMGKAVRYRLADLEAFIESKMRTQTSRKP